MGDSMSLDFTSRRQSSIEEEVMRLKREIESTGKIRIGGDVFRIDKVVVFENQGVISGWSVHLIGDRGTYATEITDRGDLTFVRIRMIKPGYVIGIGEDFGTTRGVIVYRKE
jgi:hypothetical protein